MLAFLAITPCECVCGDPAARQPVALGRNGGHAPPSTSSNASICCSSILTSPNAGAVGINQSRRWPADVDRLADHVPGDLRGRDILTGDIDAAVLNDGIVENCC